MKIPFIPVIRDYFEIFGVILEVIVIVLLWKTVKDFAELAKVKQITNRSQIQTLGWSQWRI